MTSWWQRHKKKVWIGIAITTIVVIPFGTFIAGGIYYKMKSDKDKKEDIDESKGNIGSSETE